MAARHDSPRRRRDVPKPIAHGSDRSGPVDGISAPEGSETRSHPVALEPGVPPKGRRSGLWVLVSRPRREVAHPSLGKIPFLSPDQPEMCPSRRRAIILDSVVGSEGKLDKTHNPRERNVPRAVDNAALARPLVAVVSPTASTDRREPWVAVEINAAPGPVPEYGRHRADNPSNEIL